MINLDIYLEDKLLEQFIKLTSNPFKDNDLITIHNTLYKVIDIEKSIFRKGFEPTQIKIDVFVELV